MKKLKNASLLLIVFCVMLFCTTPYASGVETGTTADGWKYSLEFGKLFITGYEGTVPSDESLTIPSSLTINGQSINVLGIGSGAFFSNNLKSVTISDGIVSIGRSAFNNCNNLESISIPNSVIQIDDGAFSDCTRLKTVTIPENVQSISGSTFSWCTSLSSVSFPQSITEIGNSAFYNCKGLTSINIPDKVKSIGYSAFSGCSSLTDVYIQDGVETIYSEAFRSCNNLSNITIPNSVTSIGSNAFYDCTSLQGVSLSGFCSIGDHAFGYYNSAGGSYVKIPGFTIKGYKGTTAETYADDNGFNFEELFCDHNWSEWITVQYAYYGHEGLKKRTCSKCGGTETETIPIPTVSPTPTNTPIPTATPTLYPVTPTWIPVTTTPIPVTTTPIPNTPTPTPIPNTPTPTPSPYITPFPVHEPVPDSYDDKGYGYQVTGFERPVQIIKGQPITFQITGASATSKYSTNELMIGDGLWRPEKLELLDSKNGDVTARVKNDDSALGATHKFTFTPTETVVNSTDSLWFSVSYRLYSWNGRRWGRTFYEDSETYELKVLKVTSAPTPTQKPTLTPTVPPTPTVLPPTPTVLPPVPTVPPTPIPTVAPPAVSEIISGAAKYRVDTQKKTAVLIAPAKKSITSLSVPATIKANGTTYKVTEISAFSCKGLKKLKKVKIGKNVKIVGDGAFSGCTALTESEIGANVQIIGKGAFNGCKKQKTVKFKGSKVKSIGQNAFKNNAAKVNFKCPAKKLKAYTILIKAAGAPKKAKYTK